MNHLKKITLPYTYQIIKINRTDQVASNCSINSIYGVGKSMDDYASNLFKALMKSTKKGHYCTFR